jgi:2-keto-4-pentenoate hydratase
MGRLFETDTWESSAALASTRFANLAIEGELAVQLDRDLPVDVSEQELLDSIKSVFPVIELHNLVFRREAPSAEELIANNAVHAGFVYPKNLSSCSPLESGSLRIDINDVMAATAPGAGRQPQSSIR